MNALLQILRIMLAGQRRSLLRGAVLSVLVLLMEVVLLGLSGWFITAAAPAGLAGTGAAFDVFRLPAGVSFLAIVRTAARYGERMLTHDATLRALQNLRLEVLADQLRASWQRLTRLRSSVALHRLIGDIDALDGLALAAARVITPPAPRRASLPPWLWPRRCFLFAAPAPTLARCAMPRGGWWRDAPLPRLSRLRKRCRRSGTASLSWD